MRSWQASRQIEFYGNNPSWKRSEKNGKERAIIELRARTIQGKGGGGENAILEHALLLVILFSKYP